jgi:hypothetical protein
MIEMLEVDDKMVMILTRKQTWTFLKFALDLSLTCQCPDSDRDSDDAGGGGELDSGYISIDIHVLIE